MFGATWPVYRNVKNENVLIKKVGPVSWLTESEIENEFQMAFIGAKLGLGPHIYSFCMHKDEAGLPYGYLIMEKIIGDTFKNLYGTITNIPPEIYNEYKRLMDIFYDNGYKHNDRHLGNFMVGHTIDSPIDRVYIIDFGNVVPYDTKKVRKYNFYE